MGGLIFNKLRVLRVSGKISLRARNRKFKLKNSLVQIAPDFMPGLAARQLGDALDQQCQHTDLDVGLNAPRCPMVHGHHFDLGAFHRTKAALNHHESLVAAGGIFQADGIVIGFQDPFAVKPGRISDFGPIETDLVAFGNRQVTLEPRRTFCAITRFCRVLSLVSCNVF